MVTPQPLSQEVGQLFKHLISQGLVATEEAAHKNKGIILRDAASFEVTLAGHGAELLNRAIQNTQFNLPFGMGDKIKGTLTESLDQILNNLVAEAETENEVLFNLIVAATQKEAQVLSS